MKEPYAEDLANHSGYESCADNRKIIREALDNRMHRLSIEPRKLQIRVLTLWLLREGNIVDIDKARC